MASTQMVKKQRKRKNKSRKKGNVNSYTECITLSPHLLLSFIGKEDTLPSLLKGYKVSLHFDLSSDKKEVLLKVTAKHRNQLDTIMTKFIDRYNKIVTISNNLLKE